ncbi:hypothetical protein C3B44_06830 [Corynebacterium yudongzhengii]|uniref:Uncharacterized protein n=1 Tax=Corynebacterium yudongzhengii TaxID=2080740 RepID=A0A2U1T9E4_9CORY|nr:hypothetical protein [Corynebacterium yudongzhengii]AWB82105.1 hypothetical protein C3B44_06830 [Corynebacterium yudongzhengii]PWC02609.1 hypothetical protein DF222_01300 [Corynebacterium yudongzhengii]
MSDQTPYSDHTRPLNRALKFGSIALVVMTVISLAVWGYLRDLPGIWGVLMGAGLGGGFVLLTALSVRVTANTSPTTAMAVILGGWLVKIVLFIIVFLLIDGMTFYDRTAFATTVIIALVVVLATEVWGIITSNVTFVG